MTRCFRKYKHQQLYKHFQVKFCLSSTVELDLSSVQFSLHTLIFLSDPLNSMFLLVTNVQTGFSWPRMESSSSRASRHQTWHRNGNVDITMQILISLLHIILTVIVKRIYVQVISLRRSLIIILRAVYFLYTIWGEFDDRTGEFSGTWIFFFSPFSHSFCMIFLVSNSLLNNFLTSKSRTWIAFFPMAFVARSFFSSSCWAEIGNCPTHPSKKKRPVPKLKWFSVQLIDMTTSV